MNRITKLLSLTAVIAAFGCSDIIVKVNKKGKGNESSPSAIGEKNAHTLEVSEVYSYLKDQDKLRELAGQVLVTELNNGFKGKFRKALRELISSIKRNAETEHSYSNGLFQRIDDLQCGNLDRNDLNSYEANPQLGYILQGGILGTLTAKGVKDLDFKLDNYIISQIEDFFLFEMGVNIKHGADTKGPVVTFENGQKIVTQSILLKVSYEEGEASEINMDEETLRDIYDHAIELKYRRVMVDEKTISHDLRVETAKGLWDDQVVGNRYFLSLLVTNDNGDDTSVISTAQNGIVSDDGSEDIRYSRTLSFQKTGEQSFVMRDIIRAGLFNEQVRKATVDFANLEKCRDDNLDDGAGKSDGGKGGKGKNGGDDDQGDSEDTPGGEDNDDGSDPSSDDDTTDPVEDNPETQEPTEDDTVGDGGPGDSSDDSKNDDDYSDPKGDDQDGGSDDTPGQNDTPSQNSPQ